MSGSRLARVLARQLALANGGAGAAAAAGSGASSSAAVAAGDPSFVLWADPADARKIVAVVFPQVDPIADGVYAYEFHIPEDFPRKPPKNLCSLTAASGIHEEAGRKFCISIGEYHASQSDTSGADTVTSWRAGLGIGGFVQMGVVQTLEQSLADPGSFRGINLDAVSAWRRHLPRELCDEAAAKAAPRGDRAAAARYGRMLLARGALDELLATPRARAAYEGVLADFPAHAAVLRHRQRLAAAEARDAAADGEVADAARALAAAAEAGARLPWPDRDAYAAFAAECARDAAEIGDRPDRRSADIRRRAAALLAPSIVEAAEQIAALTGGP